VAAAQGRARRRRTITWPTPAATRRPSPRASAPRPPGTTRGVRCRLMLPSGRGRDLGGVRLGRLARPTLVSRRIGILQHQQSVTAEPCCSTPITSPFAVDSVTPYCEAVTFQSMPALVASQADSTRGAPAMATPARGARHLLVACDQQNRYPPGAGPNRHDRDVRRHRTEIVEGVMSVTQELDWRPLPPGVNTSRRVERQPCSRANLPSRSSDLSRETVTRKAQLVARSDKQRHQRPDIDYSHDERPRGMGAGVSTPPPATLRCRRWQQRGRQPRPLRIGQSRC
jgi:hypothetical protein